MKYKAVIATTNPVNSGRGFEMFTDEALEGLASSAIGRPVVMNFNHEDVRGRVIGSTVEDGKLIVEIETDERIDFQPEQRAVPGYRSYCEEWFGGSKRPGDSISRVVRDAKLYSVGIVTKPMEDDLPEIKEIEDESSDPSDDTILAD